jgi:hypothetical protein
MDPTGFGEKLKERMDCVRLRAQLFQTQAMKISYQLQGQSFRLQQFVAQKVLENDSNANSLREETVNAKVAVLTMLERLDSSVQSASKAFPSVTGSRPRPSLTVNALPTTLPLEAPGRSTSRKVVDRMLAEFEYHPDMVVNDSEDILHAVLARGGGAMDEDIDENRVHAIQSDYSLRAWLTLEKPSLLFLDGRCTPRPKSEVSLVAAKIAHRLLEFRDSQVAGPKRPVVIPLLYFCGQHKNWQKDPNGNPVELATSLLLQLLDYGRDVLPLEMLQQVYQSTIPENMASILSSLRALITAAPSSVYIVIILDGLRFFNAPLKRQGQTREIVIFLASLYRNRPRATVKLLFASPTRCDWIEDVFHEDEIVRLGRNLPEAGTAAKWKAPIDISPPGNRERR